MNPINVFFANLFFQKKEAKREKARLLYCGKLIATVTG